MRLPIIPLPEHQQDYAAELLCEYSAFVADKARELPTLKEHVLHGSVIASKEAGELLDIANRLHFYEQPFDHVREGQTHQRTILEEGGDILFGLQVVANAMHMTLLDFMQYNMKKLSDRYKSGKFSVEEAAQRADKTAE